MFQKLVLGTWGDSIDPSSMKDEFGYPVLRLGVMECACNPSPRVARTGGSPELTDRQASQTREHQVLGETVKKYSGKLGGGGAHL